MADVSSNLYSWSTTASSNSPSGATNVGSGLDDNLRQLQATVREGLAHYNSVAVASAGTVDLGAQTGNFLIISGTTTITSFGTVSAGIWKVVRFSGALTLTYNGTSLILPGAANITTVAGDVACFLSEGSGNWRCVWYQPIDARPIVNTVLDSEFQILDNADTTKIAVFQASGITTGTTRTFTFPDASTTLVGTDANQTLSNKTLTDPALNTSVSGTALATQAQMEAASATNLLVTPGSVIYSPGVSKAWALCTTNGTSDPTVVASHNVTSVTRSTIGRYVVTFSGNPSSASYVVVLSVEETDSASTNHTAQVLSTTRAASGFTIQVQDASGGNTDGVDAFQFVVFGDL
jgi:hypothetical protein